MEPPAGLADDRVSRRRGSFRLEMVKGVQVLRSVIFDLDGVLIDSEPLYERAFMTYLQRIGRSGESQLFALTQGRRDVDFLPDLAARLSRPVEEIAPALGQALAPELGTLGPLPYAVETVRSLRRDGRAVALATSSLAPFARGVLSELELESAFDAVVTGEEVTNGKPDPATYRLAADRLSTDPLECVAIEDTRAGVAAAVGAGMVCIALANSPSSPSELSGADLVVRDLREAAAEVRRLDRTV